METRREQLLDAAIRIIVRDGYGAVSVDAIAREAGVTRPVVYGAYDGLGALLAALLDRQQARAMEQLTAALPTTASIDDPDHYLIGAIENMVEQVKADPVTWQPILLAPHGTPEQVRGRIEGDRQRVRRDIAKLLDLGLAVRGGPSLDTEVMAHAVLALMEHFGRLLLEQPDLFETDRLIAAVRGLLKAI